MNHGPLTPILSFLVLQPGSVVHAGAAGTSDSVLPCDRCAAVEVQEERGGPGAATQPPGMCVGTAGHGTPHHELWVTCLPFLVPCDHLTPAGDGGVSCKHYITRMTLYWSS